MAGLMGVGDDGEVTMQVDLGKAADQVSAEKKKELTFLEMSARSKKGKGVTYCGIPSCGVKCEEWSFAGASALVYFGIKDRLAIVKICNCCRDKAAQFEKKSMDAVRNCGNMFTVKCEPLSALPEMINLDADDNTDSSAAAAGGSRRNGELVEVDFDREDVSALVKSIMEKYNVRDQIEKCQEKCAEEVDELEAEFEKLNEDMKKVDAALHTAYKSYNSVFDRRPRPIVTKEVEICADGKVRSKNIADDGVVFVNHATLKKLPQLLNKKRDSGEAAEDQDLNQSMDISRKPGPASKTKYYEALDAKRGPFDKDVPLPPELCEKRAARLMKTPQFIPRTPPKVGDYVYVMYKNLLANWVKGEVIEVVHNDTTNQTEFIVHYEPTRDGIPTGGIEGDDVKRLIRQLCLKQMAYNVPCPFILPVGSRVIAKFKADRVTAHSDVDGLYFAGIVAEPPKEAAKNRYLIFYDDGYAQYVWPEDVLLVCESSREVWNEVYPDSYDFVKDYICKWPQWPLVKLHVGAMVPTEWNGQWSVARILEIDNCLARVRFECDGREEWVYRGSTRFRPVYKFMEREEEKRKLQENSMKENRVPRHNHENQNGTEPGVEFKSDDLVAMELFKKSARKSTGRINYYGELQQVNGEATGYINMLDPDMCIEYQGTITKTKIPEDAPKPREFVPHTCDASCVIPYVPSKEFKLKSPLVIPFHFGWAREVSKSPRHAVFYRAPCGVRLRDGDELAQYLDMTDSNLSIDYFCFEYNVDCFNEFSPARTLVNYKDVSYGKENTPVQCVNCIDFEGLPYMEYTPERIVGNDVPLNKDEDFLVCCDCTDNCQDKSKCACFQLTHEGVSFTNLNENNINPNRSYEHRRLPNHIVSGIYECNSRCKCKKTCYNRVVQNGVQWPLQIFKTSKKGWGIRALHDMPEGSFICIYSGIVLTDQDADQDGMQKGDEYLADLDYIESVENVKADYESDVTDIEAEMSSDEEDDKGKRVEENKSTKTGEGQEDADVKDSEKEKPITPRRRVALRRTGAPQNWPELNFDSDTGLLDDEDELITARTPAFNPKAGPSRKRRKRTHRDVYGPGENKSYIMDAKEKGNIGRYLNHSCAPNIIVQNVFVDTHDVRFPLVSFFTSKFIRAGTELTWDYNYEIGVVHNKTLFCYCMTPGCRGRLL